MESPSAAQRGLRWLGEETGGDREGHGNEMMLSNRCGTPYILTPLLSFQIRHIADIWRDT